MKNKRSTKNVLYVPFVGVLQAPLTIVDHHMVTPTTLSNIENNSLEC